MNGANSRKSRQFWNGPGFYAVMLLLVTAIAVAGYWTLFPSRTANADPTPELVTEPVTVKPQQEKPAQAEKTAEKAREAEAPALPDEHAEPVQSAVELTVLDEIDESDTPSAPVVAPAAPRVIVSPLEGETVAAFSVEALQYSQTLDDWRTHDGVDIAAEAGTLILAACSGTVQRVWRDDLLGCAVLLDHGDGYETLYANLDEETVVAEGEYVSAGQALGAVGETALSEAALPAHLHFAVTQNGEPVDPETFLSRE